MRGARVRRLQMLDHHATARTQGLVGESMVSMASQHELAQMVNLDTVHGFVALQFACLRQLAGCLCCPAHLPALALQLSQPLYTSNRPWCAVGWYPQAWRWCTGECTQLTRFRGFPSSIV